MKIHHRIFQYGFAAFILLATGCDQLMTQVEDAIEEPSASEPFAVLATGPIQDWYPEAFTLLGKRSRKRSIEKQLEKILVGVDAQRPAAALLYVSPKGLPEPVLYIPVTDYEEFMTGLSKRFKVKRAMASSFNYGRYKVVVKQKGEHAILGISTDGLKHCPPFPDQYVLEMPDRCDVAFKLHTKSIHKKEQNNIANAIRKFAGDSLVSLIEDNDSFVLGLQFESKKELCIQTHFEPAPANPEEIKDSLQELMAKHGFETLSEINDDSLSLKVYLPAKEVGKTLVKVQPAFKSAFKLHLNVLSKRARKPKRSTSNSDYCGGLPSAFGESGGSSAPRRRG